MLEEEDNLGAARQKMVQQNNYVDGLKLLKQMPVVEYKSYAKLFASFNSPSGVQIIKFLSEKRLKGDAMASCVEITEHVTNKYIFGTSRVSQNLTRYYNAGILSKKASGKFVSYGLNQDVFQDICLALLLLKKHLPKQ